VAALFEKPQPVADVAGGTWHWAKVVP
jgi:hypothetical protein